nr:unnamed protein product [Digitaria exilis]
MTSSGVSSKILVETSIALLFRFPSMLTWYSLVRAVRLTCPAISSSFEMILDAGAVDTNRICSPGSSKSPVRLRLGEDAMMSNAFRLLGRRMRGGPWTTVLPVLSSVVNEGAETEEATDETDEAGAEPWRTPVVAAADHVVQAGVLVVEGESASREREEDNAAGPDVGLGAVVAAAQEDLGRDEHGRPADGVEQQRVTSGRVDQRGEPEIGDLDVARVVDEDVVGLDVAVVHPEGVAVVERRHQLLEHTPRGGLTDATAGDEVGVEGAAGDELHDHEDGALGGHHLVDAHDVGVAHAAHDVDLAHHLPLHLHVAGLGQVVLVHDLDGHMVTGLQVHRTVHFGEAALAEQFAQLLPPCPAVVALAAPAAARALSYQDVLLCCGGG